MYCTRVYTALAEQFPPSENAAKVDDDDDNDDQTTSAVLFEVVWITFVDYLFMFVRGGRSQK